MQNIIIITMPGYILEQYPSAKRQLFWQPVSTTRYSFLQLGWSGGQKRKTKLVVSRLRVIGNP